jgi:probable HAF family extracellular repeat protein
MASFNYSTSTVLLLVVAAICSCACGSVAQEEGETFPDLASVQVELSRAPDKGHVIDLGVLASAPDESYSSAGLALNEQGSVVGYSHAQVSPTLITQHAFRWKAQTGMVDLGTLGGSSSSAADVNDRDYVAGTAQLPGESQHAVVWDARGRIRDLGTLGGQNSTAFAMNNRGQVVGLADDAVGGTRPFIWDANTGMVDLGLPGAGLAYLYDINDAGVVVGSWLQEDFSAVPFKWTREEGPTELDMLGGSNGEAFGINDQGEIVGYVVANNAAVGMKWTARRAWRLASLPDGVQSLPKTLNKSGLVVGGDTLSSGDPVAVQWLNPKRVERLPLAGRPSNATDINDCGEVVGSWNGSNAWHAFLWQPGKSPSN